MRRLLLWDLTYSMMKLTRWISRFFEDVTADNDWRDEYMFNDYGLDPDDYDSLEEFLDVYNDAKTQKLEDEEYDEEY